MKLGRNFVIYLGSSVISGALPLALMPFLTRRLDPAEYGTMVTITTVVALIGPLVNWAVTAYISVQYVKVEPGTFPRLLTTVLLIPLVSTVLLLALFAVIRPLLLAQLEVPPAWHLAMPLMAAALLLPQVVQVILAMRDRALGYAAIEISGAAINFAMTLVLVGVMGFAWEGRLLAQVAASLALTGWALAWLWRNRLLARAFEPIELKGALRFGVGTVAHDLANQALRFSDRLLIAAILGQASVGTYAVAVQWASILLTILAAFNRAWVPFLFTALSAAAPGWAERLVRQTYLVWGALLVLFVGFVVVTPIGYSLLIDERYHSSMPTVFWLAGGFFFNGLYMTVVDYIFYLKKTHLLAAITTFNLLLNTGLAYLFIHAYGSVGAAMAFATTAFVVMCLTFAISYRLHPMPWLRALRR